MPSPVSKPSAKIEKPHEAGALAAYGLIAGAIVGIIVGLFLGHWLFLAVLGSALGWVAGALVERARR